MEGMFYPALHLGDFADAHSALGSVGVTGALADMCAAGLTDNPGHPAVYEAHMLGTFRDGAKTMIVLAAAGEDSIRLCYGFFDLLAPSEEEALTRVRHMVGDDALASSSPDAPRFYAYRWVPPRKVLQ